MAWLRCVYEVASLLVAWTIVSPVHVAAQTSCVELVGEPPHPLEQCLSAERLCDSYQRALAADGGDESLSGIRWQVRLHARPLANAELALDIDAFAAGQLLGRRTLSIRTQDCAAVPDALALVLVLLAREAASVPRQTLPPMAAEVAHPSAAAARDEPLPGAIEVGAGAGASFGALLAPTFMLQLQAAMRFDPVALRARALLLWPSERDVKEGAVVMRAYELAFEACAGFEVTRSPHFVLRLCAGPRVGLLQAAARNFELVNHRATEFLMYFAAVPEASLALGAATWLQASGGAAVALVRPRFDVGLDGGARSLPLDAPHWLRGELGLTLVQIF